MEEELLSNHAATATAKTQKHTYFQEDRLQHTQAALQHQENCILEGLPAHSLSYEEEIIAAQVQRSGKDRCDVRVAQQQTRHLPVWALGTGKFEPTLQPQWDGRLSDQLQQEEVRKRPISFAESWAKRGGVRAAQQRRLQAEPKNLEVPEANGEVVKLMMS